VKFNGVTATPSSWQAYAIQAPVPASATSGPLVVTVNGVASNSINFTLSPGITGLNPTSGGPGTPVTISGSAFGSTQGTSIVTFNGVLAAPTSWGNSSIVVPVPAGATTGAVVVTIGSLTSNSVTFNVGTGSFGGAVSQLGSGSPIGGALIEVLQSNVTLASTTAGADGSYSVPNLNPGVYDLRVSAAGFGTSILP